jgi:COP9 signalosome complex subunit 5
MIFDLMAIITPACRYYPLEVSIFKSSLDTQILELVWQRYWAETLSQPPLDLTQEYTIARLADIGKKAQRVAGKCKHSSGSWHGPRLDSAPAKRGHGQTFQMDQDMVQGMEEWDNRPTPSNQDVQALSRDAGKLSIELSQGLIAKSLRGSLF